VQYIQELQKSVCAAVCDYLDNEKNKDNRRCNIILYRVQESSGDREAREIHDTAFARSLCNQALEVDVKEDDIVKMYRLGRKEETSGDRPLLVGFKNESTKSKIMKNFWKLKNADATFKGDSVAHDLTPEQWRKSKLIVDEEKLKYTAETGDAPENFRYMVVGQNMSRPRVVWLTSRK
jgi:hypothetical protein